MALAGVERSWSEVGSLEEMTKNEGQKIGSRDWRLGNFLPLIFSLFPGPQDVAGDEDGLEDVFLLELGLAGGFVEGEEAGGAVGEGDAGGGLAEEVIRERELKAAALGGR